MISKARVDPLERSGASDLDDHLVYMSSRSAAIRVPRHCDVTIAYCVRTTANRSRWTVGDRDQANGPIAGTL